MLFFSQKQAILNRGYSLEKDREPTADFKGLRFAWAASVRECCPLVWSQIFRWLSLKVRRDRVRNFWLFRGSSRPYFSLRSFATDLFQEGIEFTFCDVGRSDDPECLAGCQAPKGTRTMVESVHIQRGTTWPWFFPEWSPQTCCFSKRVHQQIDRAELADSNCAGSRI